MIREEMMRERSKEAIKLREQEDLKKAPFKPVINGKSQRLAAGSKSLIKKTEE